MLVYVEFTVAGVYVLFMDRRKLRVNQRHRFFMRIIRRKPLFCSIIWARHDICANAADEKTRRKMEVEMSSESIGTQAQLEAAVAALVATGMPEAVARFAAEGAMKLASDKGATIAARAAREKAIDTWREKVEAVDVSALRKLMEGASNGLAQHNEGARAPQVHVELVYNPRGTEDAQPTFDVSVTFGIAKRASANNRARSRAHQTVAYVPRVGQPVVYGDAQDAVLGLRARDVDMSLKCVVIYDDTKTAAAREVARFAWVDTLDDYAALHGAQVVYEDCDNAEDYITDDIAPIVDAAHGNANVAALFDAAHCSFKPNWPVSPQTMWDVYIGQTHVYALDIAPTLVAQGVTGASVPDVMTDYVVPTDAMRARVAAHVKKNVAAHKAA